MGFIKQMEMEHKSPLYALQGMHEKHVAFVANENMLLQSHIQA